MTTCISLRRSLQTRRVILGLLIIPTSAQFAMLVTKSPSHGRALSNVRINRVDHAEMVLIPSGEFIMGSDSQELDSIWKKFNWNDAEKPFTKAEQPAHQVRLTKFWMYQNLVTVTQFRRYCEQQRCQMPAAPSY